MLDSFIHPSSIIENGAVIGKNCHIGPFCTIGAHVVLEDNVKLISHVVIDGDTKIGESSTIYSFASLGMIPQDLKFKNERSRLEIGKNTTIRECVTASIGTAGGGMLTKIGDNCLIMAYCHIAHDCIVGNNVILVNGVNLSGHVVVEDFAIIGGMSAVKQFTRIGAHAMIGGFTGVERDIIPYGLARSQRTTSLKGMNIIGLKRSGVPLDTIQEMISAFREIFTDDANEHLLAQKVSTVVNKYPNNKYVAEIAEFILAESKNPLCTNVPTDSG